MSIAFDAYASIDLAYENAQIAASDYAEAVDNAMPAARKEITDQACAGDELTLSMLADHLMDRVCNDKVADTLIRAALSCGPTVAGQMLLDLINKGVELEAENLAIREVESAEVAA